MMAEVDQGSPDLLPPSMDLAPPDPPILDMAQPPPDMFVGGDMGGNGACAPGGSNLVRFVVNKWNLPQQRTDYARDLNGDGKMDNQLGNIFGALTAQNIDVQTTCDQSVADGTNIHLVSAIVDDPDLEVDPCAEAVMYTGQPKASPDYSGAGSFTIDMARLP